MNNLNLSSSVSNSGRNAMTMNQNRKSTGSYFYTGKTTFGGSNLRKNIHRLSMTPYSPYSHVNVKCIEPMAIQRPSPTSRKGINHSIVDEDLPLSSVTQRILDRLDKAAAPISDAKSRIPISTLINNSAKKFDISRTPKLFDTPTPIIENRDRSPHIESSFKPMKYILKPSTSSSVNESTSTAVAADKSIDDDIQKLNQIKQAEKELKE
ncbi:nuclear pore complex protein nup153-like protein, partial [Euroglyphus maynei]